MKTGDFYGNYRKFRCDDGKTEDERYRTCERGRNTLPNLSILKTNKAKAIRFSTLDAICRALQCQPSDILEYVETDEVNQNGEL